MCLRLSCAALGFAFTVLLTPFEAFAWGVDGHRIIADIADAHLMPTARARVAEILHGVPMRDVANFADEYRVTHPETSRWHFLNVASGANDYVPERDCQFIPGQGDCIVAAIDRELGDVGAGGAMQEMSLKFLIHFIGDLHQPFHVISQARGGNEIPVTYFGATSNLHRVWDTDMIKHLGRPSSIYAGEIDARYLRAAKAQALDAGTTVDWAMESRQIGLKALVAPRSALADDYEKDFAPVMEQRLALAGIRLARVINELLGY